MPFMYLLKISKYPFFKNDLFAFLHFFISAFYRKLYFLKTYPNTKNQFFIILLFSLFVIFLFFAMERFCHFYIFLIFNFSFLRGLGFSQKFKKAVFYKNQYLLFCGFDIQNQCLLNCILSYNAKLAL